MGIFNTLTKRSSKSLQQQCDEFNEEVSTSLRSFILVDGSPWVFIKFVIHKNQICAKCKDSSCGEEMCYYNSDWDVGDILRLRKKWLTFYLELQQLGYQIVELKGCDTKIKKLKT